MLRTIGADHVIDYTQEDFTKNGLNYDVIIDVVGKSSFSRRIKSLKEKGHYFLANAGFSHIFLGKWTSMLSSKKIVIGSSSQKQQDLLFLKELVEAGKIKSIIDRSFSLEEMPEAHRYADTGQKKGNIVIIVEQGD